MLLQPFQDTNGLLTAVPLPDLVLLRQRFPRPRIANVSAAVTAALESVHAKIWPGARIAIGVGSRGVADIIPVVATLVATLRRYEAEPFIVPAMGSHGGATPEGQLAILASLGITEQAIGVPIVSSLDVDVLGRLPNSMPVYIDRAAHAADGIIVVNRVKPHTDFDAAIESGLSKMIAIGLGKHAGALEVHSWGVEGLATHIPEVAKFVIAHASLLCGLAIVENGYDEVAEIKAVPAEGIANEPERALLRQAKEMMPRLPWDALDVLVVDRWARTSAEPVWTPISLDACVPSISRSRPPLASPISRCMISPEHLMAMRAAWATPTLLPRTWLRSSISSLSISIR